MRAKAERTRAYWDELTGVLDKFERAAANSSREQRTVAWINRFSREIESIDRAGVDRAALAYGRAAEDAMRELTASLQSQRVALEMAEKQLVYKYHYEPVRVTPGYGVPFGGVPYGGFGVGGFGVGGFGPGVRVGVTPGGRTNPNLGGVIPGGFVGGYYGGGVGGGFGGGFGNGLGTGFGVGLPGAVFPGGITQPGILPPAYDFGTQKVVTDSNVRSVRRDQANAVKTEAEKRVEVWTELRNQENDLEAALEQRYGPAWTAAAPPQR